MISSSYTSKVFTALDGFALTKADPSIISVSVSGSSNDMFLASPRMPSSCDFTVELSVLFCNKAQDISGSYDEKNPVDHTFGFGMINSVEKGRQSSFKLLILCAYADASLFSCTTAVRASDSMAVSS